MLRVLYFASLSDLMGKGEERLEVGADWTVARLLGELEQRQPKLAPLRGAYRVAVDLELVGDDYSLAGAREVALIPPVSGGAALSFVRLDDQAIRVDEVLDAVRRPDCGGVVLFLGTVRDTFGEQPVECLQYSAYEAMARPVMERLVAEAQSRLVPGSVALWHRLGEVKAGDISIAIAASSKHRADAFDVARWLIDSFKTEVPLWKQEVGPDGSAWVEGDARVPR
jgi:molybdopterin converting factor subunit 1